MKAAPGGAALLLRAWNNSYRSAESYHQRRGDAFNVGTVPQGHVYDGMEQLAVARYVLACIARHRMELGETGRHSRIKWNTDESIRTSSRSFASTWMKILSP